MEFASISAQPEVGHNQEDAVAHRGWWADLSGVKAEQLLRWIVHWSWSC